jgi:hypothetical protein
VAGGDTVLADTPTAAHTSTSRPRRRTFAHTEVAHFVDRLATYGDRVALHLPDGAVNYAALAQLVAARAVELGATRSLVLVAGGNQFEPLVTLLAALSARASGDTRPRRRSREQRRDSGRLRP